ncbi:MAG: glycoside hydrolase family 2 [Acidimicrobiia bacterium]|nr:glycoside hydrolase family 2 [Acidimicrobiia bacterium]
MLNRTLTALVAFVGLPVMLAATEFGPYHGVFLADGLGLKKSFGAPNPPVHGSARWSMSCWVRSDGPMPARTLLAGFGEPEGGVRTQRFLGLSGGRLTFWGGVEVTGRGPALAADRWHHVAATYDGVTLRLFSDGAEVHSGVFNLNDAVPLIQLAPSPVTPGAHFGGRLAQFKVWDKTLTADEVMVAAKPAAGMEDLPYEVATRPWPVQLKAHAGLPAPQDPVTLPRAAASPSVPVAKKLVEQPVLVPRAPNLWAIRGGWQLAEAPAVKDEGATLSKSGYIAKAWWPATVPGTVLTTLIDRGVYPDPDIGLNNMAIPERLARQDYWYRVEFTPPAQVAGKRLNLIFEGINYAAEVWMNGRALGNIRGAFVRGDFDVTDHITPGRANAVAVRISPPPHPGIPHEQSIVAGPGPNGGIQLIDGPTFFSTEGWDWLPGIRDRNSGLWQDVTLRATGVVRIGDPHVLTTLPKPDNSQARVTLKVPLRNSTRAFVEGTLTAAFEGVRIEKRVRLEPGETVLTLAPEEFKELLVNQPRLWWPNGYGKPELYHLELSFRTAAGDSDQSRLRFGIREIRYELTLLDATGRLKRIEYAPAATPGVAVVDVRHEGMLESSESWVASLKRGAELSSAIRPLEERAASPMMVVRVNGVRIALKGGNWGISDSRKRVSRERLEPYIRLTRDANFTIIRNWCGQSMEEVLFELCDEYGILVWNDFWGSTQDHSLEAGDLQLFRENARDTLLRFRHHPSIVLWCGENEGVPSPARNEALEALVREFDGTRYYSPNSRRVNLQASGPWRHGEPVEFFTDRGKGFSTELGLPSAPTLDTLEAMLPKADQWPPNDTWAYHDWHSDANGDIKPFMASMTEQFGAPTNLKDFDRKAQLMNYANHRAMFEGFNAHLWRPNTGRFMWMSHPAWPSLNWQMYSSDYDTHGAYYGIKKACEPIHVQLNLPGLRVAVINNTAEARRGLRVRFRVVAMDGRILADRSETLDAPANTATEGPALTGLTDETVFVRLDLSDNAGQPLSNNFYWQAPTLQAVRALNGLATVRLEARATERTEGSVRRVTVTLANRTERPALMVHLSLRRSNGERVLPAYADDNYVSLLPGEERRISFECAVSNEPVQLKIEGWNSEPMTVAPQR